MSAGDDVRQELVGKLTAAGVRATDDPRAVPPCVLVGVPTMLSAAGVGGWNAEYPVWIVSPPPDDAAGLRWRLDQLDAVYGALGFARADPDQWGDRDAPAYRLTFPRTVTNPNC